MSKYTVFLVLFLASILLSCGRTSNNAQRPPLGVPSGTSAEGSNIPPTTSPVPSFPVPSPNPSISPSPSIPANPIPNNHKCTCKKKLKKCKNHACRVHCS